MLVFHFWSGAFSFLKISIDRKLAVCYNEHNSESEVDYDSIFLRLCDGISPGTARGL